MKTHDLIPGSPEWLAHRDRHFNASDAPAMMGVNPNESRGQLLKRVYLGMQREFSDYVQERVIDPGHRYEALARPLAEKIIGESLYPVVGSVGKLSASFDGLTIADDTNWEHKRLNADLRAAIRQQGGNANEFLPPLYTVQMEHQSLVSGAERTLFMASDWDDADKLLEERHCWYTPDPALRQQIIDGWAQFERDLAAYVLPDAAEPAPVGKAPDTLPALRLEVTGAVTASNLAEFKATALDAIRSVNRNLRTDQDFADAEKAVKWCADVETRLKAAKEHALAQTADIDALFKAIDDIGAEARTVRLDLDKLVARRKTEVKEEAVAKARKALDDHIATLNGELAPMRLPNIAADFAGCIKGLKSFASMQDKLDGLLTTTKIAAEVEARAIRKNIEHFKEVATGLETLFPDLGQLVHKSADDFRVTVQARVLARQERDRKAEEARQAAEAQRIAAAEQRAREQEAARIAERQRQQEAAAAEADRLARLTQAQAAQQQAAAVLTALPKAVETGAIEPAQAERIGGLVATLAADSAITEAKARADEPATLKLGDICGRLGFTVTAAFVGDTLHIKPAQAVGNRPGLYTESQFALICRQLQSHVSAMAELYSAEATA